MTAVYPTTGKCGARSATGLCKLGAGWGTEHVGYGRCKLHGGASPQAEVAGQVWLAKREAMVMGVPLDVAPHDALLECIRIAAGEVRYSSEQIALLESGDATGPVRSVTVRPAKMRGGADNATERAQEIHIGPPALNIWIEVRHKAMDRLVSYSTAALKAGLEERLVRVAEGQAQQLAGAVRGILEDLGMVNHPDAPRIVRKHLMLLAGTIEQPIAA